MPRIHRIAAVQAAPLLFDPAETEARFAHWLQQARAAGATLAVFPEAFLGGYPKGVDFGARVGSRSPGGRDLFRRYAEAAYARDGAAFARIRALVADAALTVVVGVIERLGRTLYCVSATLGPDGAVLAWRRKLMPTAMERLLWGQGDGATLQAAETPLGRISSAICWENYMPLLRVHLYGQRPVLHAAPTVDDRDVWLPTLQTIALEGRCFVVSACQYMTRADVADGAPYTAIQGDAPETVLIRGGSAIVGPLGAVLAGPLFGECGVVCADIDLDDTTRAAFDFDVVGHYARPDIFTLTADTTPRIA